VADPIITIFIPTYKRPHLLRRAVESALAQTYQNIQVIVSDNDSSDETSNIAAEFLKKNRNFRYFRQGKNIGMLPNYLFGLSQIHTEYFSFLSDDDILLPWYCEEAMKTFTKHPEIAFFAGSTIIVNEKKEIIAAPIMNWRGEGLYSPPESLLQLIGNFPVPTSVMFKKSEVEEFEIDRDNPLYWDCDFLMQIASQKSIFVSKKPCAIFNAYSGGYSSNPNAKRITRLIERINNFNFLTPETKKQATKATSDYFFYSFFFDTLKGCLEKNYERASSSCNVVKKLEIYPFRTLILKALLKTSSLFPLSPVLKILKVLRDLYIKRPIKSLKLEQTIHKYME
jgi:glycosyltransferase involved in cell wall biosynthesis